MKKIMVGDFETTVFQGQTFTEVWASAIVELNSEDVKIFHSISDTFEYLISLDTDIVLYYHNLKFDGSFWINYLLSETSYKQAYYDTENAKMVWCLDKEMPSKSFKYMVSDMGAFYSITIKIPNRHYIYIRDSLKLLPFSVRKIGKSFGTKHSKLEMEYTGFRYAGCEITDEEKQYIANDVLVVKEALEIMYEQGHDKLTIGACCLSEFHKMYGDDYDVLFPDLRSYELPESYGSKNAENYIRKSYRGGWCYAVPNRCNQLVHNGVTADVNSLYPSMMSSESGNHYPVGKPTFWKGNFIPEMPNDSYYFVRFKTRFYLKNGYLPFVHIRDNIMYKSTENLVTSDVLINGTYYPYTDDNGVRKPNTVTLTMTCTDYVLFREHYDVVDFEILDGCFFTTMIGIFDNYINKYKKIKMTSTGAIRELAKLFLNNLYGKLASSDNSSYKVAYLKDNGAIGWLSVIEHDKQVGYIPIGSAITSYARNFTIRTAQKNYHPDSHGFIYADTDSIHCDISPDELVGVPVHETNFCCWKLESCWDVALFVRQKTYIEHITAENLVPLEKNKWYYNVKCAGMPEVCKDRWLKERVFIHEIPEQYNALREFKIGLKIDGKLLPKQIRGGVLLCETTYEMR